MTLTIVVLDQKEKFLQFLDPDLCSLTEEIEYAGLRTLKLEYKFEDIVEDKELFRVGNKIWIHGDTNLRDCLYVINTEVSVDIYKENEFTMELEEVLVELNYAPLFSQTDLTTSNGFRINNVNDAVEVYVDWNALNKWFGDYFNIGVVQDCLSENASKVTLSGTFTLMNLLRQIEEETGNVFVTRYEKDCLNNTIHRYLDFLNPINSSKNWNLTLLYEFQSQETYNPCVDEDGDPCLEDDDPDVTPFEDGIPAESIPEDTNPWDESQEDDEERNYDWIPEDETVEDYYTDGLSYTPLINLNPDACQFQICNREGMVLNTDGEVYSEGDTALSWDCTDAGLTGDDPCYTITLQKTKDNLGVTVNATSSIVTGILNDVTTPTPYSEILQTDGHWTIADDMQRTNVLLPDDVYLEIYDYSIHKTLFRTKLDTQIGTVHEEVLDFGFNLENITYEIDETETYTAISPVIKASESTGTGNNLNRGDINTIINRWKNLSINKGNTYPMIVDKITVTGTSWQNAASTNFGNYTTNQPYSNSPTNWWCRPLRPNDNTDSDSKTYEFYRAKAYWRAPYTKYTGDLHVSTTKDSIKQYNEVTRRPDNRNERGPETTPKMGTTETTDEDIYAIYNQVALYLQEHEVPEINIEVDVANLQGYTYNNYDLHDKVYLKMPNTGELLTARVTKTSKEAHDIAKNTIELSNYRNINTIKTLTHETSIDATNTNFKYPNSQNLTARLINLDYDPDDEYSIHYPANKLLTFTLYKVENGSSTYTGKTYTKITDTQGYATISMKYDPGDYEMEIYYAGDEEFEESSINVKISVGGTLPVSNDTTKTSNNSKTAKTKYKTVKRYWTKCGLSPKDKNKNRKTIVAVAKPSSADAGKYSYRWYKTVFKNYCPNCKKSGGLRFDGGKKTKCITSQTDGLGYKPSVQAEKEITCAYCDSDYCGVTGQEKSHGHISRLKTVKKPVKSSKTELNKLIKGKLVYDTKKVKVTAKNNSGDKQRKVRASGISSKVKKQALSIVGKKTGSKAAHAIVEWIDKNIHYAGYPNFQRSPNTVLSKKSGNCCDVTRLCLQMLDAAGCSEFYKMYYIHVPGHVYARLITKKTGKNRPVDCASDYHGAWGYICRDYRGRSESRSRYPKLPF